MSEVLPLRSPRGAAVGPEGAPIPTELDPLLRVGLALVGMPEVALYVVDPTRDLATLVAQAGEASSGEPLWLPSDPIAGLVLAAPQYMPLRAEAHGGTSAPLRPGHLAGGRLLVAPLWSPGGPLAAVAYFAEPAGDGARDETPPAALGHWLSALGTMLGVGVPGRGVPSPERVTPSSDAALDALLGSSVVAVVLLDALGEVQRSNARARARWGQQLAPGARFEELATEPVRVALGQMYDGGPEAGPAEVEERVLGGLQARKWRTLLEPIGGSHSRLTGVLVVSIQWNDGHARAAPASVIAPEIDELTGLPNRALAERRLDRDVANAGRRGSALAVVMIALDRFRRVNDSLGHAVGDALLRQVAERLATAAGEDDTVARIGGDEFLVILSNLEGARQPLPLADRLRKAIQEPFHVEGHELAQSASLGMACFPEDAPDGAELRRCADIALHRAKELGRGRIQRFEATMQNSAEDRHRIEREMRRALEDRHFVLFYQPKYSLTSGAVTGSEALIRWFHPDRGIVSPGQFVPVAEETGLIDPIGTWTLIEACRQQRIWRDLGLATDPVSVNVAPMQFVRPDFVGTVERALDTSGLPASSLEIEVTESMLMQDVETVAARLAAIRTLGVRVSVDDFGTGYSSLAYLQRLPVDVLKIDRAFVKDLDAAPTSAEQARVLATAICGLGHSLGLRVIAEGVETVEQLDVLLEVGCDEAQGFLLARPAAAADLVDDAPHPLVTERRAVLRAAR